MGETEMAMRETVVTYVCDRCEQKMVFSGDKISAETRNAELTEQRWSRVHIGGSPESTGNLVSFDASQWYRDLCGSCISALGQFLRPLNPDS